MDKLDKKKFLAILEKYNSGTATESEVKFLDAYYKAYNLRRDFTTNLNDNEFIDFKFDLKNAIHENIQAFEIEKARKKRKVALKFIISAAAAIVIIIGGLTYYPIVPKPAQVVVSPKDQEIVPGGNKAMLTLSDGRKIILTDAMNGTLAKQAGIEITKTADGQLVYTILDPSQQHSKTGNHLNTIETPNGGQYQIRLQDGSIVWLNAASKLTYPSSFSSQDDRRVELQGEAYFEIAKDVVRPFYVKTATQEVEVLGTHFNINSYEDEPSVRTTLLEGSVQVKGLNGGKRLLKPGQQSALTGNIMRVKDVDTERAVAWKNHQFVFESDNIRYIMRMISRWYDVEVQYSGPIPENKFGGAVSRFENVSEVLKSLESTGRVKFKIEGKRIIVSK